MILVNSSKGRNQEAIDNLMSFVLFVAVCLFFLFFFFFSVPNAASFASSLSAASLRLWHRPSNNKISLYFALYSFPVNTLWRQQMLLTSMEQDAAAPQLSWDNRYHNGFTSPRTGSWLASCSAERTWRSIWDFTDVVFLPWVDFVVGTRQSPYNDVEPL